jgi:hypothetical protein
MRRRFALRAMPLAIALCVAAGAAFAVDETVTMTPQSTQSSRPVPQPTTAAPGSSPLMTEPVRAASGTGPLSGQMVMLSPADRVWIGIPQGWIACDDANNAKLGGVKDPYNLSAEICVGPRKTGNAISFGAFDPRPYSTVAIFAGLEANSPLTAATIDAMSDSDVVAMQTKSCPMVQSALFGDKATVESCSLARNKFAGRTALVYFITFLPPGGSMARCKREMWLVPYAAGVMDFYFTWPILEDDKVTATIDRIKASVVFQ